MARVAPRHNVEGPPHPGRIRSHLRSRNPSISLQLQQPGDENAGSPGRYRPARCGNPNATGWLLIVWRSWSQRAARVVPRYNVEVPPHPGRIGSHPRIRNPSVSLQLQQPGDESGDPPGRYGPTGYRNPTQLAGCCLGEADGASARRELHLWPTLKSRRTRGG